MSHDARPPHPELHGQIGDAAKLAKRSATDGARLANNLQADARL
jgi:hypothetical protein